MESPSVSVIISVYNKFNWVKMVLAGLELQSCKNFEVIIADDGSGEEFQKELQKYGESSPLNIQHVWQEDKGFRKTRILNKAIAKAKADYLIFIDGDCIPARDFVADHLFNRAPDTILAGRRTNLSPEITQSLTPEKIRKGELHSLSFHLRLWRDNFKKKSSHVEKSVRIPQFLYKLVPVKTKGILGCNFSIYKKNLLEINGFDMRYEAPAFGEDTDIDLRLNWLGKKVRSLNFHAVQYHLYHKRLDRESDNHKILASVQEAKNPVTPFGIKQL